MFNSNYGSVLHLFRNFILKNTATLKSGSGVIQGHRNWYHSIACLCFPISTGTAIKHPVPDQVKLSFVIFDIRTLLTLSHEHHSAWMSKITNEGLTWSG